MIPRIREMRYSRYFGDLVFEYEDGDRMYLTTRAVQESSIIDMGLWFIAIVERLSAPAIYEVQLPPPPFATANFFHPASAA